MTKRLFFAALLCCALPAFSQTAAYGVFPAGNTTSVAVPQTKPVLDARDFGTPTGSNAGTLIQAAHDSAKCPSTGCVIDARGFGATDTIAGLSITKPVEVDFGATTYSVTATITVTNVAGVILRGSGSNSTIFHWAGGVAQMIRL